MTRISEKLDKILETLPAPCGHPPIPDALVVHDAETEAAAEKAREELNACPQCRASKNLLILVLNRPASRTGHPIY